MKSFILLVCTSALILLNVLCECPRKLDSADSHDGKAPGIRPVKHYIQTTFIYRSVTDGDKQFSQVISEKLAGLRPKLKNLAYVTVDNENVDCSGGEFPRCREYPLDKPYHFLVVEDSVHGAAVYSIDLPKFEGKKGNKQRKLSAIVEMAILDALSRHSLHPLVSYASEEASKELGFIREVSSGELEEFIRQNHEELVTKSKSTPESIFTRSPFELQLLNERILEQRKRDFPIDARNLVEFRGEELTEAIDSSSAIVFVLFWTEANSISVHAFELWSRVSSIWKEKKETGRQHENMVIGSVACHDEPDVCRAFAISHEHQYTLLAFQDGRKVASQMSVGDVWFYLDWIQMVLGGPFTRLDDPTELDKAKDGILRQFEISGKRTAVTIGAFGSDKSDEFRNFEKAAKLLNGRYHIFYTIKPETAATISTYRPLEKDGVAFVHYSGTGHYNTKSILRHITHSSLPSVLDIGHGFTSDVVFRGGRPALLLVFDAREKVDKKLRARFGRFSAKSPAAKKFLFLQIDRANSVNLKTFLEEMQLAAKMTAPALCLIKDSKTRCALLEVNVMESEKLLDELLEDQESPKFNHKVRSDSSAAHPLKFIQLERIKEVFGGQQKIAIQAEPMNFAVANVNSNPHDFANMEGAAISGCPMMAHMNNHDEL